MSHFCYNIKLNGRTLQICLPTLYDSYWRLKPQPDPWTVFKPDPNPWKRVIKDDLLKDSVQDEIAALTAIAELSNQLGVQNKKLVNEALQKAIRQLELPADITVELHE